MFITPSFKKSLLVEQFQGNHLKPKSHILLIPMCIMPNAFQDVSKKFMDSWKQFKNILYS